MRTELQEGVDAYFAQSGLSRHATAPMVAKSAILLLWLAGSYVGLLLAPAWWLAVPMAMSLGLAIAGIGFNVQHDGNHGAYSKRPRWNRLAGLSLDLLGGSSYFWSFKHNITHHTWPNVSGADDDIDVGPLARLSPHDRRYGFHRFQHLYMWFLYMLLAVKWQLIDDFRAFRAQKIASTNAPRPRGAELALFVGGKLLFLTLAFGLPLLLHPAPTVVVFYLLVGATSGLVLGIVFQLAHCVEEAAFESPSPDTSRLDHEWARVQLDSTVDFARGSRWLTWYLGGLNFQVEHHLFPRVCHVHYPALSPIVEAACTRNGVRHRSNLTAGGAVRSHYRLLRRLGRPEAAAAPASGGGAGTPLEGGGVPA